MSGAFGSRRVQRHVGAPLTTTYPHLWRFNDAVGVVAPDTGTVGTGAMTLDSMNVSASGVTVAAGDARAVVAGTELSIDLNNSAEPYTLLLSTTSTAWGFNNDFGRYISTNDGRDRAIEIFMRVTHGGITYRIADTSGTYNWSPIQYGLGSYNLAIQRLDDGRSMMRLFDGAGTFIDEREIVLTSESAQFTTARTASWWLRLGNNQGRDRAFAGTLHWAALQDSYISDVAQLEAIFAGGRP